MLICIKYHGFSYHIILYYAIPWMFKRRHCYLTNRVSTTYRDVVMKGINSFVPVDQHPMLLDHEMCPHVIGSYVFVPSPRIIGFPLILSINH